MRQVGLTLLAASLLGALAGCGPAQTPVPAGAQQVHVVVVGSSVRLNPAMVRAGDVYVILDEPTTGVAFVQGQETAEGTPGPLDDDDLARLARGDTQGTGMGGFEVGGCDAAQRAAARGQTKVPGGCGNAFKVPLGPGKYAFMTGDPAGGSPGVRPSIAVLQVLP
jgi:hypothetical protein